VGVRLVWSGKKKLPKVKFQKRTKEEKNIAHFSNSKCHNDSHRKQFHEKVVSREENFVPDKAALVSGNKGWGRVVRRPVGRNRNRIFVGTKPKGVTSCRKLGALKKKQI